MSFYGSLEKDNSINIYINDRLYNINDKGKGECEIILIDNSHISFSETYKQNQSKRAIIIDITLAWNDSINNLSIDSLFELAKDIHLLADIYWIESLSIIDLSNNIQLGEILKSTFRTRLQNELALGYY
ncbi:hypothetical protein [Photobacterium lutimaris]|uniref:Uncharacterized protein n=1 Tax=Photobacterium lutimaris TaxID=388278 RepID=A0A2T3IQ70_9GAMM|nr:hypothetical protein [Photobacterium lutimaris]PSU30499.1 hypothetical protein C9I99_23320 [Photobacterium lutimaris]TDR76062.1 hypothetical protein DFP78_10351 [Photobacterium lutimaris]